MNPEENNPLANPGVPNFGVPNNPTNFPVNDQFTNDNLSMAGDSLTAAGMAAAPTAPRPVSFNQIDAPAEENSGFTPVEEPIVPADPVPGSIGSVTSVPPAEPLANPFAPADNAPSGAMPAPEVQPQAAPYNPFSQPAASEPAAQPAVSEPTKPFMTPAKDTINPAFQPAPTPVKSKSMHSMNPLTAILAIACALLLISTITFVALFINAKNNPKVVYVPSVSEGESDSPIKLLTCAQNADMSWLANDAYTVPATRTLSMTYSGEEISGITDEVRATFANDADAAAGRDIYESVSAITLPSSSKVQYNVDGNILSVVAEPEESPLTDTAASAFIYGSEAGTQTTSLSDVQSFFERNGLTCAVE